MSFKSLITHIPYRKQLKIKHQRAPLFKGTIMEVLSIEAATCLNRESAVGIKHKNLEFFGERLEGLR
jgi:hypothetical protein